VCGEPDDLKQVPEVSPPGTRRLDVTCDHVTVALRAMRELRGAPAEPEVEQRPLTRYDALIPA